MLSGFSVHKLSDSLQIYVFFFSDLESGCPDLLPNSPETCGGSRIRNDKLLIQKYPVGLCYCVRLLVGAFISVSRLAPVVSVNIYRYQRHDKYI